MGDESMTIPESRLRRIGIPKLFWGKTLESYVTKTEDQRGHWLWCSEFATFVQKSPASGILIGAPGTGKTHLACGVAVHVALEIGTLFKEATCEEIERVRYARVGDVIRWVKDSWSQKTATESQVIAKLTSPRLLILDEVGVQKGSEFERDLLFSILDTRYSDLRPTLLVSNLDLAGITDFLGARAMDRLREHGTEVRVFEGESYRSKAT